MTSKLAGFALSALILYFAIHTFAGDQGLGEWSAMQSEVSELEAELAAVKDEVARLERNIMRLTPGTVDPDYVEALAREKLKYVRPDEIVLNR